MKLVWFSYACTVVLGSVLIAFVLWIFNPLSSSPFGIEAPIPAFLSRIVNKEVTTTDLFHPVIQVAGAETIQAPVISAKSALIYDMDTEKTLYAKSQKSRLPMASLTKIMTAIVALENPQQQYTVSSADLVGEDSMGLTSGETLTLEELLYGMLLPSGNDAAETIANNYPEGRDMFIKKMNEKAVSLGLTDTNFTNPSGLQGDGEQYTTVYDLLVMTNYALNTFPLFRQIVAIYQHDIPATSQHKSYTLYNETNLLTTYPGVKGVKTGFTYEAGYCLVTYLTYGGHHIIGVILGSENRREEMKELLDYSLLSLGTHPPAHN